MTDPIVLGGPDPFPSETDRDCLDPSHGYHCTRNTGHDGSHVATAAVAGFDPFVAATWTGPDDFREATVEDVRSNAGRPGRSGQHRGIMQIGADYKRALLLHQTHRTQELDDLLAPYFTEHDWCCLFAFTGGLMGRVAQAFPPVPPGSHLAVIAKPGTTPTEEMWGHMVVAHLKGDTGRCMHLFHQAITNDTVRELVMFAVSSAAAVDRRMKAAAN